MYELRMPSLDPSKSEKWRAALSAALRTSDRPDRARWVGGAAFPWMAAAAAFLLCPAPTGRAQAPVSPAYTAQDLGVLPTAQFSYGYSINNAGDVTGESSTSSGTRGFLYSNVAGTMVNVGVLPGAVSGTGNAINDSGQVVGADYGPDFRAWTYNSGTLSTVAGVGSPGWAYGINNAGTIVGSNGNAAYSVSSGTYTNLGTLPGGFGSSARGINNNGQIVGFGGVSGSQQRAWIYSGGVLANLGVLAGGTDSYGRAINDLGQAVGVSGSSGGNRGFIYSGGTMTSLGTLAGGTYSDAYGINNYGQIVGFADTASGNSGFLYSGGVMSDVRTLVQPASGISGIYVYDINEWGQMTGSGIGSSGFTHAVLLNPVNPLTSTSNGGAERDTKFVRGMDYDAFTATTNTGGLGTTADLLDGTTGSAGAGTYGLNRDVDLAFSAGNPSQLASDRATFLGTEGDIYVISLSYDPTLAVTLFGDESNAVLGRFEGGEWVLAVDGNTGGGAQPYFGAYNAATDFELGNYGVDTATNTVWAVVNGNGTFAVVPEPGACTLLAIGLLGAGFAGTRRRKRSS